MYTPYVRTKSVSLRNCNFRYTRTCTLTQKHCSIYLYSQHHCCTSSAPSKGETAFRLYGLYVCELMIRSVATSKTFRKRVLYYHVNESIDYSCIWCPLMDRTFSRLVILISLINSNRLYHRIVSFAYVKLPENWMQRGELYILWVFLFHTKMRTRPSRNRMRFLLNGRNMIETSICGRFGRINWSNIAHGKMGVAQKIYRYRAHIFRHMLRIETCRCLLPSCSSSSISGTSSSALTGYNVLSLSFSSISSHPSKFLHTIHRTR